MLSNIMFASVALNVSLTVLVVLTLIFLGVLERYWLKKKEENLNKWVIVLIYIFSFVLLIASSVFILFIWNFDLSTHIDKILTDGQALLNESVSPLINSVIIIFISITILKVAKVGFTHISTKDGPLKKRKQTITKVMNSIVKYLVSIISILVVLSLWGVNVAPALAGLGILGLVIGLGAQKFINDLISGFFIVFEHHFDVGDKIDIIFVRNGMRTLQDVVTMNSQGDSGVYQEGQFMGYQGVAYPFQGALTGEVKNLMHTTNNLIRVRYDIYHQGHWQLVINY